MARQAPAQLTLLTGPGVGKVFTLNREETHIGRIDSADLQLTDEGISRNHALIRRDPDGSYQLVDAGSRNGSYINGRKLTGPQPLQDGDEVRFGVLTLLKFSSGIPPGGEQLPESSWSESETVSSNIESLFGRISEETSAAPALLVALSGAAAGKVFQLKQRRVTLGRDDMVDLQIQDVGISRRHAAISKTEEGGYSLEDLGSSNGTFANQKLVDQPYLLRDGDMIQLGTMTVLRFIGVGGPEGMLARALDPSSPGSRPGKPAGPTAEIEEKDLEKELALARKVQMAMVPPDGALFDTPCALFTGVVRSASFAAGDLWTHVDASSRLSLLIADVTGHGVGPAMITTVAKSCLDTVLLRVGEFSLEQVFDTLNRVILGISKRTLVMTAFAVEIDPERQLLSFCSAGHIPQVLLERHLDRPLLVTPLLGTQTSPLGESLETRFVIQRREYQPGDRLVIFTDGLLEAVDSSGAAYGSRRLHQFLRENDLRELQHLLGAIVSELERFTGSAPPEDDVTVVVAELKGRQRRRRQTNPGFHPAKLSRGSSKS
jgi:pSer/pThr/pTyr-binding forkhead associated (FHA) protein